MIELPGHQLKEVIYIGQLSVIYRSFYQKLNRHVIIKLLKVEYPNVNQIAHFKHEFELTKDLSEKIPNKVIGVYEFIQYHNTYGILLEDFDAISLTELMKSHLLTREQVVDLAIKIVRALEAVHAEHVLHKDINPSNIVINPKTGQLKLIDFGISSTLSFESFEPGGINAIEGTLSYISPEQTERMNRVLDYRSDYYSFGISLYEILTGVLPFKLQDPMKLVYAHIAKQPKSPHELNPEIPLALSNIVMKLISKTPEGRYQSTFGILDDLYHCQDQLKTTGSIADFKIAQKDYSPHLHLSEKLYGRELQIHTLMEALKKVSQGSAELIFITGDAGIGKSMLVDEIYKSLVKTQAYYIKGKCDQFKRNIPYQCLVQALEKMMQQIVLEGPATILKWRGLIQKAVGARGKIITDILPDLKLILGTQPDLEELGPLESQNRFKKVFSDFFRALCSSEHPLVIFLDDLQWVDLSTLEFLGVLLSDIQTQHLLVIGAYRNQEMKQQQPIFLKIEELKQKEGYGREIALTLLSAEHINQLLVDTLRKRPEETLDLAELCFLKTQGNPFFVNQLLRSLYQEQLIWFDYKDRTWQWALEEIKKSDITDNVVEFMTKKIATFPAQTRELLQIAACIGSQFNLKMLVKIANSSIKEMTKQLLPAIQDGLIIPQNENYKLVDDLFDMDASYRFLHDRVQQSASLMLNREAQKELHYRLARVLIESVPVLDLEDRVFEIVNHLNQASDLVVREEEKVEYFKLNMVAGSKAKASSAFREALGYFQQAYAFFPALALVDYATVHRFFLEYSACLYINGEFELAEKITLQGLKYAKSLEDRLEILRLQINLSINKGKFNEATTIALKQLKELGLSIPLHPSKALVIKEFLLTKWNIGFQEIPDLIQKNEITNSKERMLIQLLLDCSSGVYYTGNLNLTGLILFTLVNRVLRYGLCKEAAQAFMSYAIMLVIAKDWKKADQFGNLALQIAQKYHDSAVESRMIAVYGLMVCGWSHHWKTLRGYFQESLEKGLQAGELTAVVLSSTCVLLFDPSLSLDTVMTESPRYLSLLKQSNDLNAWGSGKIQFQFRANLNGQIPDLFSISDDEFDEEACLQRFEQTQFDSGKANYHLKKAMLFYIYDDFKGAQFHLQEAAKIKESMSGVLYSIDYTIYSFHVEVGLYPHLKGWKKIKAWFAIRQALREMKKLARHCPENFLHHQQLMQAEVAKLSGRVAEAEKLYDASIETARQNQYLQGQAFANELAAKFYMDLGLDKNAKTYLRDARYGYHRWGAHAKVKHLEDSYPSFYSPTQEVMTLRDHATTTNERTSSELLDFMAVMKASHLISREIHLPNLVEKMMQVVVENAGAEKGCLLLKKEGQFFIEALAVGDSVEILPPASSVEIPHSIVTAVELAKEAIVLEDACQSEVYRSDPYIKRQQAKSILCIPLLNLNEIKGILYLENNLVKGVFTPDRLDLIQMLSTQMAISIDNARFYGELEDKVKQRTLQLQEAQNLLIQKEKMAYLGLLTTGISHEIKNPLNFIINFSKFSLGVLEEFNQFLSEHKEQKIKDSPEIEESIEQLQENTKSTLDQGVKADTIVNRMREHSFLVSQQFILADIHQLVEHAINLSYLHMQQNYVDYHAEIERQFDSSIQFAKVYESDLQRVIVNLLDNAYYSTLKKQQEQGSAYQPKILVKILNLGKTFEIRIRDNGQGILPDYVGKIFTPFFTTNPPGKGVGLGLSLCHNIITKEHGGSLTFDTKAGEFAEFIIALPID